MSLPPAGLLFLGRLFLRVCRLVDVLIGAVANVRRELAFFEDVAARYGLVLEAGQVGEGVRGYRELFARVGEGVERGERGVLEGLVVLWGTEKVRFFFFFSLVWLGCCLWCWLFLVCLVGGFGGGFWVWACLGLDGMSRLAEGEIGRSLAPCGVQKGWLTSAVLSRSLALRQRRFCIGKQRGRCGRGCVEEGVYS